MVGRAAASLRGSERPERNEKEMCHASAAAVNKYFIAQNIILYTLASPPRSPTLPSDNVCSPTTSLVLSYNISQHFLTYIFLILSIRCRVFFNGFSFLLAIRLHDFFPFIFRSFLLFDFVQSLSASSYSSSPSDSLLS